MVPSTFSNQPIEILVVDDTPANLRLLSYVLSKQGYTVRVASGGQAALEAIDRALPDLILLDILMPEIDGFEVCQTLKANPRTRDVPVIFLSALHEAFDKVKAFQVGGADYVSKPFEIPELVARIEYQMRLRVLQTSLQAQNERLQQEIEARRRIEEELSLLLMVTRTIEHAATVRDALNATIRAIGHSIGARLAEVWQPRELSQQLVRVGQFLGTDRSEIVEFAERRDAIAFKIGEGLPGRAWQSRCPETSNEASSSPWGFAVPVLQRDRLLAVFVFFKSDRDPDLDPTSVPPRERDVELVESVVLQTTAALGQKQMESLLRETEERYRRLVENAAEGIYQSTPDGRYLSVNPALARLYGYDSPEEITATIDDIAIQLYVDPRRRREFIELLDREGSVSDFESMVYRRNRTILWISENARAVRDSNGVLQYYEGIVSDITTRKLTQEALKFQKEQTEQLLSNILPAPVAERLQAGQITIADRFDDASILFADLVGFTQFSARKTPTEVVEILNSIFSQFDRLCERYCVEKIKTIGDAYMVAGGVPVPHDDSADAIADLALEMQSTLAQFCQETGEHLQLRVGIHIGPVVAGAIGLSKFAYDLWGDTVNTASRMESNGVPGRIQVSKAVRDRLHERFKFEWRGEIPVKGKGTMTTYFLLARKCPQVSSDLSNPNPHRCL
ncbi:MAG: response regulator [Cyanobacteria bacterium SBC]|nr:response regulator [Cyanobacteria bacterium SBC]